MFVDLYRRTFKHFSLFIDLPTNHISTILILTIPSITPHFHQIKEHYRPSNDNLFKWKNLLILNSLERVFRLMKRRSLKMNFETTSQVFKENKIITITFNWRDNATSHQYVTSY